MRLIKYSVCLDFNSLQYSVKFNKFFNYFFTKLLLLHDANSGFTRSYWTTYHRFKSWISDLLLNLNTLEFLTLDRDWLIDFASVRVIYFVRVNIFHQWQCSIVVTCLHLYHVISILLSHWWKFWWRNTDYTLYRLYVIIILSIISIKKAK